MLFKKAYNIVKAKNHLTEEGLMKIVSSNALKNVFPNVIAELHL
jgi:hypothetical protein